MASNQRHSGVMDALKEGGFEKITPKAVFVLYPGYGLKFVYAMIALLSEGKYDVIIPAPNHEVEAKNLNCGQNCRQYGRLSQMLLEDLKIIRCQCYKSTKYWDWNCRISADILN